MILLLVVITMVFPTGRDGLNVVSPQLGFVVCFVPGIIYAFQYLDKWNLNLSSATTNCIIIGLVTFVLSSYITFFFYKNIKRSVKKSDNISLASLNFVIEKWKIDILILIELVSLILTLLFVIKTYGSDLSAAIFAYRNNANSGTSDGNILPGPVKLLRRIAIASGYIVLFLLLDGIFYKVRTNRFSELICLLLALLNGFMLGGRGDGIQLIVAAIIQYFAFRTAVYSNKKLSINPLIVTIIALLIIGSTFIQIGNLLGRQMDFLNSGDYMAVYLSAELKNLDIFISTNPIGHPISQSMTLLNAVNTLGKILSMPGWIHQFDIPFRYYGNYALGNVGTIFYPFIYDGGIFGIVVYTAIMSMICQIAYQKFLDFRQEPIINLNLIFYSYLFYTIIFSFFSNKFYEMVFNTSFLWTVLSWIMLKYFLLKIKIKF